MLYTEVFDTSFCAMTQITWSKLSPLDLSVINTLESKPGVFRLSYKSADGSYYVFYVGRTDTSIKEALAEILSDTNNVCIKTHLNNLECYFKYVLIDDSTTRRNVERTVYEHFKPKCNTEAPSGQIIEIDI